MSLNVCLTQKEMESVLAARKLHLKNIGAEETNENLTSWWPYFEKLDVGNPFLHLLSQRPKMFFKGVQTVVVVPSTNEVYYCRKDRVTYFKDQSELLGCLGVPEEYKQGTTLFVLLTMVMGFKPVNCSNMLADGVNSIMRCSTYSVVSSELLQRKLEFKVA